MNLTALLLFLQRRFSGLALLILWLSFLVFCSPLHAQTPQPSWKRIRSAAPPFYADRMEIGVSTPTIIQIRQNKPGYKEIDAEARLALRIVGEGDDAIFRPFWMGQADFNASATKRSPDGSRTNIYDPQKYLWTVAPEPAIPVAQPAELHPALKLAGLGAGLGILPVDPVTQTIIQWQNLPPSYRTTIKLAAQEAFGLEETAVDGRPLSQLKTNVSRPDKHFYWQFGESRDDFPQTTSAQVVFTGLNAPDAIGPAEAKINWQVPTRTVYDVEVKLWNWTTSADADAATSQEWMDKVLTDPELQREILFDTGLEVVGIIPVGRVAGAGGKVILRVLLKNKASARVVTRVIESSFLNATKRAVLRADGSLVPAPAWHKTHKIKTLAKDSVRRREPTAVKLLKEAGEDALKKSIDDEEAPEEEKQERDDKSETFIDGGELYMYGSGYWGNPNNRGDWPEGFYLTDMPPAVAATLRAGQHSFSLFGHPYENTASYKVIGLGQIRVESTTNGVPNSPQILEPAMVKYKDYDLKGKSGGMPYQNWNYKVFVYRNKNGSSILDARRIQSAGVVAFQNPPGYDVPAGNRFPTIGDGSGTNGGTWFLPGTTQQWINPVTGQPSPPPGTNVINPVTGRQWRADMDWLPDTNSTVSDITGGTVIPFRNGYPVFDAWVGHVAPINPMKGNEGSDFDSSDDDHASAQTPPQDRAWAKNDRQNGTVSMANGQPAPTRSSSNNPTLPNWTWHHHQDMRRMMLVPGWINSKVAHDGGAKLAGNARW